VVSRPLRLPTAEGAGRRPAAE